MVLDQEEISEVAPLWDDYLIGKFLDKAPHIAKVHAIVNKIWTLNDKGQKIEVYEVNDTMMKFRIFNQADKNRILRRGMWNLAGVPVVMTKWSPVTEKEKPPAQSIPMWVHIKNVPLKMFSWQGLSFVASPLGSPVRLHPETAQCLKIDVAKIFVRVDLTKDLPTKMNFNIQGEDMLVEYSYPWLPTKCPKCDKWGHSGKACSMEKEGLKENREELEEGEIEKERQEKHIDGKVEEKKYEKVTEEVQKEDDMINEGNVKNTEGKGSQRENQEVREKEWSPVSPARTTNQKELKFGSISILTKSRFSVLTPEEDKEEDMIENEKEEQSDEDTQGIVREAEEIVPRQMLPRESKVNHRYLKDKMGQKTQDVNPSSLNKKKPRRQ